LGIQIRIHIRNIKQKIKTEKEKEMGLPYQANTTQQLSQVAAQPASKAAQPSTPSLNIHVRRSIVSNLSSSACSTA
jgi:hypothetical protein